MRPKNKKEETIFFGLVVDYLSRSVIYSVIASLKLELHRQLNYKTQNYMNAHFSIDSSRKTVSDGFVEFLGDGLEKDDGE